MKSRDDGFTLIELMIVVLIIGVLVAIAIPVFGSARTTAQEKACFTQERIVEGAYNRSLSTTGAVAAAADWDALMAALVPSEVHAEPRCPAGGTYTWVAKTALCDLHGSYHDAP